jgi:hypothetical protein
VPATRTTQIKPSVNELVRQLAVLPEEGGLQTEVPPGIVLEPTNVGHQFHVLNVKSLTPTAQSQIACTLDQYWIQNPTPNLQPTTQLIVGGLTYNWDGCEKWLASAGPLTAPIGPSALPKSP